MSGLVLSTVSICLIISQHAYQDDSYHGVPVQKELDADFAGYGQGIMHAQRESVRELCMRQALSRLQPRMNLTALRFIYDQKIGEQMPHNQSAHRALAAHQTQQDQR